MNKMTNNSYRDNSNSNFDIGKTISELFKNNIIIKHKSEGKTHEELLNYTIELEIINNDLSRRLESNKYEMIKLKQNIINLETDVYEGRIQLKSYIHKLQLKDTIKLTETTKNNKENSIRHINYEEEEVDRHTDRDRDGDRDRDIDEQSSIIDELSLDDNSLLGKRCYFIFI